MNPIKRGLILLISLIVIGCAIPVTGDKKAPDYWDYLYLEGLKTLKPGAVTVIHYYLNCIFGAGLVPYRRIIHENQQ